MYNNELYKWLKRIYTLTKINMKAENIKRYSDLKYQHKINSVVKSSNWLID